jgi:hypothetical protein
MLLIEVLSYKQEVLLIANLPLQTLNVERYMSLSSSQGVVPTDAPDRMSHQET